MGNILIHPALYDWEPLVTINGLAFHAPNGVDRKQALDIYCQIENWLEILAASWGEVALIYNGSTQGLRKFAMSNPNHDPLKSNDNLMIELASKQDIDNATNRDLLVAIEDCSESAAITRIRESKVLACSNLIQSTNGKPPDEVIGSSLDSLWHPDQLDRLMSFLERDGRVENYDYWCWKWHLENGLWVRKRQGLAARVFQLVQFKGVQCRLSLGVSPV
jgi:hypothetical protein